MDNLVKVDFHIHSNFSDGMFSPEILVDELSVAGVEYAALTDHDNIDGLQRLEDAAATKGITCVNGVEMTVSSKGNIYHLLAYGFDRGHKPLYCELERNYKHLHPGFYAKLDKLKSTLCHFIGREFSESSCLIPVEEALSLIHDAGGYVFLAHPLTTYKSAEQFDAMLIELKEYGLDGIEAFYKPYSKQQSRMLIESARQNDLMVCCGSDFHGEIRPRRMDPGLMVSRKNLEQFCQMVGLENWTGQNRSHRQKS